MPLRLLAILLTLLATPALAKRVALVIGNGAYVAGAPLANAARDARDVADRLRGLGFEVVDGYDLTRTEMLALTQDFAGRTAREDVALFYYAGHGVQIGRENHLIPVDGAFETADALAAGAVRLQSVLATMELRAATRVVILDACRDNPFAETVASRSGAAPSRGLARVDAGVGSFIAFSTEPGAVASDGSGRNSPFTAAFLTHVGEPGADIHAVMRRVRADVVRETNGRQTPWENSSLVREVFLAPGDAATPAAPAPAPTVAAAPSTQPAPQPKPAPAPAMTTYHYVDGLDPNGDNFLALRTEPAGRGRRIDKMGPGTLLEVTGQDGPWLRVRLTDGRIGWAHSNWIRCCRQAAAAPASPPASSPAVTTTRAAPRSCDELWYARNSIWDRYGYCFKGARGQAAFGANGCSRDLAAARAAMSAADAREVERLSGLETAQGCR